METPFAILRPGAKAEAGSADLPPKPEYRELSKLLWPLLDTAGIERVLVLHNGAYTDMFVDGQGVEKGLPRNDTATRVYRNNFLTHHEGHDPESLPVIYGDAVLFSRKVWF